MKSCKENKNIKNILKDEVKNIEVSPDLFNKIRKNIYEEEQKTMKNNIFGRKKGIGLIMGACLLVGSITAVATTLGGSWISQSHTAYNTFPSKQEVQKDVGFLPKYVEELPGGFKFTEASIGSGKMMDEAGKVQTKTKEVDFEYKVANQKDKTVSLNAILVDQKYLEDEEKNLVGSYKNIDLDYYNQTYKFIPENYELTAEDNKAILAGELEVSYGSDKVEIQQVQSIGWYEDGVSYSIMGFDQKFEVDELINMAKTVIDAK